MKVAELFEARRNPAMNPKINAASRLRMLLGSTPTPTFISFTKQYKLGINPMSPHNTPIGIYGYQSEAIDRYTSKPMYGVDIDQIRDAFPYASDRPYIQVFTIKRPLDGIYTDTYTARTEEKYFALLEEKFKESYDSFYDTALRTAKAGHVLGRLWNLTRLIAMHVEKYQPEGNDVRVNASSIPSAWNKVLREIGIDFVVDNGEGIIHGNEPYQSVILNPRTIRLLDTLDNRDVGLEKETSPETQFTLSDVDIDKIERKIDRLVQSCERLESLGFIELLEEIRDAVSNPNKADAFVKKWSKATASSTLADIIGILSSASKGTLLFSVNYETSKNWTNSPSLRYPVIKLDAAIKGENFSVPEFDDIRDMVSSLYGKVINGHLDEKSITTLHDNYGYEIYQFLKNFDRFVDFVSNDSNIEVIIDKAEKVARLRDIRNRARQ